MRKLILKLYKIKSDKWIHLIAGIVIAEIFFAIYQQALSMIPTLSLSIITTALVAATKEAIDVKYGVPSWKDFLFTMIGCILGLILKIL